MNLETRHKPTFENGKIMIGNQIAKCPKCGSGFIGYASHKNKHVVVNGKVLRDKYYCDYIGCDWVED